MSFSTPQVESITQFWRLTQDVEQGHNQIQANDGGIVIEVYEERLDWNCVLIMVRLALVGMLLIGLSLRQRELLYEPTSDMMAPKLFLDSFRVDNLKVSDGELSSTWDVALTISNVMNYSNVNILSVEAKISYEEKETLAVAMLERKGLLLEEEESKRVKVKLRTTGWEENQPIVDDNVVYAIAKDVERGVIRFSLDMMVMGKVELDNGWEATFTMYPKCSDLEVKFVAGDQLEANIIHPNPRECVGLIQWGHL